MATGLTFQRTEKKYLLSEAQYRGLLDVLTEHMTPDEYGQYTICNIYYDTPDSDLIRRSIEKPVYKEKLRLRTYGVAKDGDSAFLEIKKKYKGEVYKRRIVLPLKEAMAYLERGDQPSQTGQIFREIDYMIHYYGVEPKLYLAYDRTAFAGVEEEAGLRVTFDTRIRSRTDRLDLREADDGKLLLPQGIYLMEIKAPGAMPLWLTDGLTKLEIYPVSFSKYGKIYENQMMQRDSGCIGESAKRSA
ncbi:MAG: polyphosphate polymerase domain-containing protein [Clostridia bacterium]|nr:polyphosphate polymerase domain-containing protein [Clostridia bacterium]